MGGNPQDQRPEEFIRWLLSSRLRVACDADPPETTVGRHTPMKLYIKYLAQAGINTTSDPEDVLARRFTKRVLCHLLKGVRFARKPVITGRLRVLRTV